MNGTVKIEHWTVTISGRTTRIRGPFADREKREILRRRARTMLGEWGEFDEITLAARALRPMVDPRLNYSARTNAPVDSSRDAWGKPRNGHRGPEWVSANCLRSAIATMKRWNIDSVPDPAPFSGGTTDWFVSYNDELGRSCGIRLEEISPSSCPPAERQWIAALSTPTEDDVDHAVIASGHVITHDPNGRELNGSYISRNGANALRYGLRLVAANAPRTDAWGRPIR